MAIRKIVEKGDEILAKKCKPVKEVTKHIQTVTRDMIDTMIEADGVGLAAPQIGIMKRMFVCRPELEEPEHNYVFINPEILEKEGEQDSMEAASACRDTSDTWFVRRRFAFRDWMRKAKCRICL